MSFQASDECRPGARSLRRDQLDRDKVPQPSYASRNGEWGASKIDWLLGGNTSDRNICEAMFLNIFWQIDISQIDHHRASHQVPHAFKIEGAELFPFSHDDNGVGFFDAIVR